MLPPMEAIIFTGIQASGKSTFYKERFYDTHLRINLDMLHSRRAEDIILNACLWAQRPFVVDNTNPSKEERARYIERAKFYKYRIISYVFASDLQICLQRNKDRAGKKRIPEGGVRSTYARLSPPSMDEGFDEIYFVDSYVAPGKFNVRPW